MAIIPLQEDNEEILGSWKTTDGEDEYSPPEEVLPSANELRRIHAMITEADEASERNRAKVQDLKDFKPPLNEAILRKRGQGSRFNVNFGDVAALIQEAESQYIDSFVAPEHLIDIKLETGILESSDKYRYERIMSDEFTKMVRSWDGGLFSYLVLIDQFVTHGVGIAYYEDSTTWQWQTAGLGKFKFPRKTNATPDSVTICTCESEISLVDLADKISDEEAATNSGWDVDVVKHVIMNNSDELYNDEYPEEVQERHKANDSENRFSDVFRTVRLIHGWFKEKDGSISFYIASKNPPTTDGQKVNDLSKRYLYKKVSEYKNLSEAMHIFPFFTGNGGNIYTIRGLGYMVYAQGMAINLIQNALLDSAKDSMSVKYISPNEKAMDHIPIVHAGPATLMSPSINIAENQKGPDLQRSAMPALDLLSQQMNKKSVSANMTNVFSDAPDRRSKYELTAALEHFNSLNSSAMLLFSRPWRSLITVSISRAFDPIQNTLLESGIMAKRMQNACIQRGVPPELFERIDLHETKSGVPAGPGGKAARAAQYDTAATLYTSMDDVGRQNFDRDKMIDIMGVEKAARYLSFDNVPRETPDHQIARLENNDLLEGSELAPSNSENYLVHLRIHIEALVNLIQQVESGEADLVETTKAAYQLYLHAQKTYEIAVVPEMEMPEMQSYEQQLQQIGEYINNGLREIQKLEREGQMDAENQQETNPETEMKAEEHMQKLRITQEAHEQNLALQRQKAMQELAIKDAQGAQKLRN